MSNDIYITFKLLAKKKLQKVLACALKVVYPVKSPKNCITKHAHDKDNAVTRLTQFKLCIK